MVHTFPTSTIRERLAQNVKLGDVRMGPNQRVGTGSSVEGAQNDRFQKADILRSRLMLAIAVLSNSFAVTQNDRIIGRNPCAMTTLRVPSTRDLHFGLPSA